jgi:hypothetical protein
MKFTFKLVYTDIVYTISVYSDQTLNNLFDLAGAKFENHIDFDKYYIDYVIAGQDKGELAIAVSHLSFNETLGHEFGDGWKSISFYVRPVERATDEFIRRDRYDVRHDTHIHEVPDEVVLEEQVINVDYSNQETLDNGEDDLFNNPLPPPPGLTIH